MYLHILAREIRDFGCESPIIVDWARRHLVRLKNSVVDTDAIIIFTERRSLMNDTGTISIGHISIYKNLESLVLKLI